MDAVQVMLFILLIMTSIFGVIYVKDVMDNKHNLGSGTWMKGIIIGFITDFLDTLGIGSFAITTSIFKFTKTARDEYIPSTLNVAHTIPIVVEAFLFMTVIEVEIKTLVLMIGAAVLGAYFGSGIVMKMDKTRVQFVMGVALAITAGIMFLQAVGIIDGGTGTATGLEGWKLVAGVVGNFLLGALMCAGVGLYAPCMALVAMLGLSPEVAFPIMMGSCAFLMPVAGVRYVKGDRYERKMSLGITIGGVFGVLVAFYIVGSMDLTTLTWLVIGVIVYTSYTMLKSYKISKAEQKLA